MRWHSIIPSVGWGLGAALILLGAYFAIVSAVSGWSFAASQFGQFWYFIAALAVGFGIQIGLYTYLKRFLRHGDASGQVVAATGTTSTAAMVSCCAHYLASIVPILGATGFAALVGQYQVKLFWIGLAFNLAGIAFISNRVFKAVRL